ncbi:MAG: hypothetical protein HYY50_05680 [Candidatus Kerfeldbacteria bacterium]|nr:hypothetical protein [Candidatus Kerfeldbacteria bacterium]
MEIKRTTRRQARRNLPPRRFLAAKNPSGFTLLDTVLTLFVVGTMVLLFASLINARQINRRVLFRAQAAALADEELNALRRLGFDNLTNQTNGSFHTVLYPAGSWRILSEMSADHSTPNVLELSVNTGIGNAVSGRRLFPAGVYDTSTLEAKWKVVNDSPAGWAIGFLFHASDSDNGYRLRIAATGADLDGGVADSHNLYLESLSDGAATAVFAKATSVAIATGTWYTLRVELAATTPTIKIYIDGNQQDTSTIADTAHTSGAAALLGWGGVHAYVDDVQTMTATTETWDFDADTAIPAAWVRLGLNELPDNTPNTFDDNGLLSIEAYPTGSTTLKKVTVTIQWQDGPSSRSYTTTSLIGQSDLGI